MSLENQYDAWVRGLMGGGKYAATPKQAEDASEAVQQMQAQLDAQKRQSAAGAVLDSVQRAGTATAENVRKMSSELTKSLRQDGLLGGTVAAPSPAPRQWLPHRTAWSTSPTLPLPAPGTAWRAPCAPN